MKNLHLLFVIIFFISATTTVAQEQETKSLESQVDSLMAEYDQDGSPGGIIGVVKDGDLIFAKGYGMADLAHGVPITTETRFNLASVSKQFTGFAFALLEKRGEISLDDPVRKYLSSLPEFDQTVTLRHLLTHTSGYREAFGPLFLVGRRLASREEALEVVRRQPELEFPAGSKFQYSSSAYVLLTKIAERITGQPFPDWMAGHVFDPLEMESTTVKSEVGEVIPKAASSYADAAGEGYREPSMDNAWYGSADVYATVGDLAKWLDNFQTAELGGKAVQERMRERFVLTSGDTTGYGLGLNIDEVQGLRRIHHGGTKEGYQAQLTYYPELDAGVLLMTNYGGISAGEKAREVAEIAFGEHIQPEEKEPADGESISVDAELLERYAGAYEADDGRIYVVEAEEGQLFMVPPELDIPFPLAAQSETLFQMKGQDIQIRFRPDADGNAGKAAFHSGAQTIFLLRVESWHPTAEELEAFAGQYFSPELEATYTVTADDSQLVAEHRWIGEIQLSPVAKDVFAASIPVSRSFPPFGLQVRFERGEEGAIIGFHSSIFRTSGVWFNKKK